MEKDYDLDELNTFIDKQPSVWTPFPPGCKIVDIKSGGSPQLAGILYAKLVDVNGVVIISSTLDYIIKRLKMAGIVEEK